MPTQTPTTEVCEAPEGSPGVPPEAIPRSVTIDAYDKELAALARLEAIQADDQALHDVCVVLKMQGYTVHDLADLFAMDAGRVRRILRQTRAAGALHDVVSDLEHAALPLAVEKLLEKLDAGDYPAIRDTLRGLGAFKTHASQTGPTGPQTTLEVTFNMPTVPVVMNPQAIVGQPRESRHAPRHARRLEGATPDALRARESGRALDGGGGGEAPGGEGDATP